MRMYFSSRIHSYVYYVYVCRVVLFIVQRTYVQLSSAVRVRILWTYIRINGFTVAVSIWTNELTNVQHNFLYVYDIVCVKRWRDIESICYMHTKQCCRYPTRIKKIYAVLISFVEETCTKDDQKTTSSASPIISQIWSKFSIWICLCESAKIDDGFSFTAKNPPCSVSPRNKSRFMEYLIVEARRCRRRRGGGILITSNLSFDAACTRYHAFCLR